MIQQLMEMGWDIASFRAINAARGLISRDPSGQLRVNGMLHGLLDRGFFDRHLHAVRRLSEVGKWDGTRAVSSLRAVLDDMLLHRALLVRSAMVQAEETAPSADPMKRMFGELAHARIDQMVGVTAAARSGTDVIPEQLLKNLTTKIHGASSKATTVVNKFLAHAATPSSRAVAGADTLVLTLRELWAAHQALCEVAGFLLICVLGESAPGFLPVPQFDQFEYLDVPLIDAAGIQQLKREWSAVDSEFQAFSQWSLEEYFQEFPRRTVPPPHAG